MQKSGIKFLRVLPKTIVGLSLALGMTTSTHAAEWALGGYYYNAGNPGNTCYTDYSDYVVYDCQCNSTVVTHYDYCPGNDGVPECRLEGNSSEGYTRFCWLKRTDGICDACGCNNSTTSWSSPDSGNRVSRTVTTVSDGYYSCTSSTTTEYGCAAGYYKSAGNGSSMTCKPCDGDGTSNNGNATNEEECYRPAGSSFEDDTGTYTCGGRAYWQN